MKEHNKDTEKENPRIEPLPVEDMRLEWKEILQRIPGDGLKGKYAPVNVLGSLMHNPDTLGPFLDYWVTSKQKMGFTIREQEIVILRMGFHYNCNYVWKHHIPVAIEFGLNEPEIQELKSTISGNIFSERERAILMMTDEMMRLRNISADTWKSCKCFLQDSEVVDLISLMSQYVLFALTNNVLQVVIEKPLEEIEGLN